MTRFEALDLARRSSFCSNASDSLGLPAASIEKDYWVCWTLRELFALRDPRAALTFKGGTSLSKAWSLIERFSEDIDVVIDRRGLGFGGGDGPDADGLTVKERTRRLERLREAAAQRVAGQLLPELSRAVQRKVLGGSEWKVGLDPDDKDGQTLLLEYPTETPGSSYVRNAVKVEFGARSDTEPSERRRVASYLATALGSRIEEAPFEVNAVVPERTLWEKAMLLHEEGHRAPGRELKGRLSRHYYDLACLIERGVGERALRVPALFHSIAAHRRVFFARNQAAHGSMRLGTLRLVPTAERIDAWRRDFEQMRETMFFVPPPSFDQILATVQDFEERANKAAGAEGG